MQPDAVFTFAFVVEDELAALFGAVDGPNGAVDQSAFAQLRKGFLAARKGLTARRTKVHHLCGRSC